MINDAEDSRRRVLLAAMHVATELLEEATTETEVFVATEFLVATINEQKKQRMNEAIARLDVPTETTITERPRPGGMKYDPLDRSI